MDNLWRTKFGTNVIIAIITGLVFGPFIGIAVFAILELLDRRKDSK